MATPSLLSISKWRIVTDELLVIANAAPPLAGATTLRRPQPSITRFVNPSIVTFSAYRPGSTQILPPLLGRAFTASWIVEKRPTLTRSSPTVYVQQPSWLVSGWN